MGLAGHYWTLRPFVEGVLRPPSALPDAPLVLVVPDARHGEVRVRARYADRGGRRVLVALHGLGGDVDSTYLVPFARAALEGGFDVVRLGLRGSDGSGEDLYHAGLDVDLHALFASPALARYESIVLAGFSLGGHVALRAAARASLDPRVRAVAAVGSPIDLARGAQAFDEPARWLYRRHVLASLKAHADALHRRGRLHVPHAPLRDIRTIVAWDDRVVAPRFGYASAAAYYEGESMSSRLAALRVPALYVGARHDPMVPFDTVAPSLSRAPGVLVRWTDRAGHVGFPPDLDLGFAGPRGLSPQVVSWLARFA